MWLILDLRSFDFLQLNCRWNLWYLGNSKLESKKSTRICSTDFPGDVTSIYITWKLFLYISIDAQHEIVWGIHLKVFVKDKLAQRYNNTWFSRVLRNLLSLTNKVWKGISSEILVVAKSACSLLINIWSDRYLLTEKLLQKKAHR